jgi:hypothetical protein
VFVLRLNCHLPDNAFKVAARPVSLAQNFNRRGGGGPGITMYKDADRYNEQQGENSFDTLADFIHFL